MKLHRAASRQRQFLVAVFAVLFLLGSGAHAQVLYGSLTGTVEDASGAAVPGATITITNVNTGQALKVTTNANGVYLRPDMQEGRYDLMVTEQGFKTDVVRGIEVTANSVRREDVKLELGEVSENVTVSAEAEALQTDKTDLHTDLTSQEITDIPLGEYRNFQSLLAIVPGTTPGTIVNSIQTTPDRSLDFGVNGVSSEINDTQIDGIQSVYLWLPNHAAYIPSAESIQRTNISTNNFDAEQGMAGGVVVNVITKSGTNNIHGSLFAINSNVALQARNYYNSGANPYTNINIDGATIGGPIKKNKLFYFFSLEQIRELEGYTALDTVPTADQRIGNFSAYAAAIYDPATGSSSGTGRTQFPSNIIPQSRLDPIALQIQALIPMPNASGVSGNYSVSGSQAFNRTDIDARVAYNISGNQTIWAKYNASPSNSGCSPALGAAGGAGLCSGDAGQGNGLTQVGDIGFTDVLTPKLVWDGVLGYLHLNNNLTTYFYGKSSPMTTLGIPGTNGGDGSLINSGAPQFSISGYSALGEAVSPYFYKQDTYVVTQNLSWEKEKHDLRFGFQGIRHHMNFFEPDVAPQGTFTFTDGITALSGGPAETQYNAYAAFLLGLPQTESEGLQTERYTAYDYEYSGYAQDHWQVLPKLTLTAGVRYELYPMMTRSAPRGGIEEFNPATNQVTLGGIGSNPPDLGISTSHKLFTPRLGFAYRVGGSTVFRGGYGIATDPLALARPLRGFYPLTTGETYTSPNTYTPYATLEQGVPPFPVTVINQPSLTVPLTAEERFIDGNKIKRGYIESWNVVFQHELPWHVLTSVAYVGTQIIHQFVDVDINAGVPGGGTAGQPLDAAYGRSAITWAWNGRFNANYNALQIAFSRRTGKGLLLHGAYTFSKAMDYTDDDGWASLSFNTPSVIQKNHALSGYDIPQNLQLVAIYRLPFGRGSRFFTSGVSNHIFGGWEVNGHFSGRSGTPFTVTSSATSLNAPDNTQTAIQVKAHVACSRQTGTGEYYCDPTAFAPVTTASFGTTGRDILFGPHWVDLDASVFREFRIRENLQLQFRAQAFNATNTPHFGAPNANVSSASFMKVTTAQQDERSFRFGLRLHW